MFDKTSRMWDSEEVKIRIKQLYRLGRDISYSRIFAEHPHLLFAAVHYFRNWGHAVTACGIDYTAKQYCFTVKRSDVSVSGAGKK